MNKVIVSVPGKAHLMGEHAVVYGKPALLAAVDLRLSVTVEERAPEDDDVDRMHIISTEPADHVRRAVHYLLSQFRVPERHVPVTVTIRSDIPSGYHLGSSAAVAVALSGAFMYFFRKLWNPVRINELAYEIEKFQHGTPSGGDNTTVTAGGFVWYRKELEFLKSIWQLPFPLHKNLHHFVLADTGRPRETTGEMVAFVRERVKAKQDAMYRLFDRNEEQVRRIAVAVKSGDGRGLIEAVRAGEHTLEEMGVVSERVVPFIRAVENAGGAAKILGGGGRKDGVGFLLCYHHEPKRIAALCEKEGYALRHVKLGEEGIRLEKK